MCDRVHDAACNAIPLDVRVGESDESSYEEQQPKAVDRIAYGFCESRVKRASGGCSSSFAQIRGGKPGRKGVQDGGQPEEAGIEKREEEIAPCHVARRRGRGVSRSRLRAINQSSAVTHVRWAQERSASAPHDLLHALGSLMAAIAMQVAGDEERDFPLENILLEKARCGGVGARVLLHAALIDPLRLGHAKDDSSVLFQGFGNSLE